MGPPVRWTSTAELRAAPRHQRRQLVLVVGAGRGTRQRIYRPSPSTCRKPYLRSIFSEVTPGGHRRRPPTGCGARSGVTRSGFVVVKGSLGPTRGQRHGTTGSGKRVKRIRSDDHMAMVLARSQDLGGCCGRCAVEQHKPCNNRKRLDSIATTASTVIPENR